MFGPRLKNVFASRTNALWWSAMVLITAYCVAAEPPAKMELDTQKATAFEEPDNSAGDPWADLKDVASKRDKMLP